MMWSNNNGLTNQKKLKFNSHSDSYNQKQLLQFFDTNLKNFEILLRFDSSIEVSTKYTYEFFS